METVRALAHAGADVVLCSRSLQAGQKVAEELQPAVKVHRHTARLLPRLHFPPPACLAAPLGQGPPLLGTDHLPAYFQYVQGRVVAKQLDLADLRSVKALADDLAASLARLDLLVLNAGAARGC